MSPAADRGESEWAGEGMWEEVKSLERLRLRSSTRANADVRV